MNPVNEPAKRVDVVSEHDVIVCGGGPAGVAAAIAAARTGANTRLIEVHGCLGGVWTAGLLGWILDGQGKHGFMRELMRRLFDLGAISDRQTEIPWGGVGFNPEIMKLLLETMCAEAGVDVRLHTRVVAGYRDQANRLETVITESKSGREAWRARVFIDATGDGDLAARSGCGFELGHPETGQMQPMTLWCLWGGVDERAVEPFIYGRGSGAKPHARLLEAIRRGGHDPSYAQPAMFRVARNLFAVMVNHEYRVSGINADDLTAATIRAREELHHVTEALRSQGEPWSNLQIVATSEQIGVREGRRILGRYRLTRDDLVAGHQPTDVVCRVNFPVDVHALDPDKGKGYGNEGVRARPYGVPLRSLIAADVDGLLMAGRCISGDFIAHASYRVTGNAVAMGEAAGRCAAAAVAQDCLPHEVTYESLGLTVSLQDTESVPGDACIE